MAETPEYEKQAVEAWCDEHYLHARLRNKVVLSVPLWFYPDLLNASMTERNSLYISPTGLHWDALDVDVAIQGMFEGWKDKDAVQPVLEAAE